MVVTEVKPSLPQKFYPNSKFKRRGGTSHRALLFKSGTAAIA